MLKVRITNRDLRIRNKSINLQLDLSRIAPVVVTFTDGDVFTAREFITTAEVQGRGKDLQKACRLLLRLHLQPGKVYPRMSGFHRLVAVAKNLPSKRFMSNRSAM